ncbi:MAG: hypothetical protein HYY18_01540 [Planctomycetes bacterium]|nr:hypothetical protein [Planctomycetota bacterium]
MRRNLTLVIDEDILDRARLEAARRRTTVNSMIRDYLASIAGVDESREEAVRWLIRTMKNSRGNSGGVRWTRDELHER